MATKKFKNNEYTRGGQLRATVTATSIIIDFAGAKIKRTFPIAKSKTDVFMWMTEYTSAYWADQVTDWIETKVDREIFQTSRW